MRNRDAFRSLAFVPIVVAAISFGCARRDVFHSTEVSTQITRLDAILRHLEKSPPAGFASFVPHHREALTKASRTSDAALRLYRLRDPFVGVETLSYAKSHSAAMNDLAAFEKLWGAEREAIVRSGTPRGTTLERALYESAMNRAQVLVRASLPYARTSSPGDGLYYLAEAVGNRKFAEFVDSVAGDTREATPPRDGVETALDAIDAEMLAAFEKEPTGKTTIPASALSKESHELLRRGWTDGAALLLVEARIALTKRTAGTRVLPDTPLQSERRDDSLSSLIAAMATESEPQVRRIVRAQVAPMYASLFDSRPRAKTAAGPVTITLVRWPYT